MSQTFILNVIELIWDAVSLLDYFSILNQIKKTHLSIIEHFPDIEHLTYF